MNAHEQWQLAGDAAELYERYAARYILGPWAPLLIELAALQKGERVLDLACGTGAVARLAAGCVGSSGRVTGLDLNAGMLAVARSLPAPAGATVQWVERSALETRLPDRGFDVVLCQQGLQFFPDQVMALREMRRVLVPDGRVAISVWRTTGVYNTAVGNALRQHVGLEAASRFCASRHAPTSEELRDMVIEAGLRCVKLHVQRMVVRLPPPEAFVRGHLAATPIASDMSALSPAVSAALVADVTRQLAPYRQADRVVFSEEINVVTANA